MSVKTLQLVERLKTYFPFFSTSEGVIALEKFKARQEAAEQRAGITTKEQSAPERLKSSERNVTYQPSGKKRWRVMFNRQHKAIFYAYFATYEEAVKCAREKRKELFGEV